MKIMKNNFDSFQPRERGHLKNKLRWAKPTIDEQNKAELKMKNIEVKVFGKCWKEDDCVSNNEDKEVLWIQCDTCGLWLHQFYIQSHETLEEDTFICEICQKS